MYSSYSDGGGGLCTVVFIWLVLSEESLVNCDFYSPQITLHVSRNGQQQFYSV